MEERRLPRDRIVEGIDLVGEDTGLRVGRGVVGIDLVGRILSVRVGLVVGIGGGRGCEMSHRYLGVGFRRMGVGLGEESLRSWLAAGVEERLRKEVAVGAED